MKCSKWLPPPSLGICILLEKTKTAGHECVCPRMARGPALTGLSRGAQHTSLVQSSADKSRFRLCNAAWEEVLFHRYKYSTFLEPPLLYSTRPAAPKHKSRRLGPRWPFTPLAWAACCDREPTLQTWVLLPLRCHTDPQTNPEHYGLPCHACKICTRANRLLSAERPEDLQGALAPGRCRAAGSTHTDTGNGVLCSGQLQASS